MNRTLLHIDASARGDASDSARLTARFVDRWQQAHPDGRVVRRDITTRPLPHLDQALLDSLVAPVDAQSPEQAAAAARVDELVSELLAADVLVLGVPMYNFGIPSTLKAWIDHVSIPGRTFDYTAEGPRGLIGGRSVYVLSTRGGVYGDGPMDHQVAYLRALFGLLGIDDVRVIQAEGLDMGDRREPSLDAAHSAIDRSFDAVRLPEPVAA